MDFHLLSSSPSEVKCHTGTKNSYQSLCKPCLNPASPCACANVHKGQWIHNVCITHPLLGPVNGSVRTKVTEYTPHNYPCDGNMVSYISFIFHDCTTDTTKNQYPTNSFKSKFSFVLTMSYSSNIRNKYNWKRSKHFYTLRVLKFWIIVKRMIHICQTRYMHAIPRRHQERTKDVTVCWNPQLYNHWLNILLFVLEKKRNEKRKNQLRDFSLPSPRLPQPWAWR